MAARKRWKPTKECLHGGEAMPHAFCVVQQTFVGPAGSVKFKAFRGWNRIRRCVVASGRKRYAAVIVADAHISLVTLEMATCLLIFFRR
jgi:hypothetical protein